VSPGPTFDRVYVALKEQLVSGCFAPGEHLEPTVIGNDLNASITPVRDALHRLVGEKIVEAPRNDGFRVPAPTEAELRNLYRWNQELLELALRKRTGADDTRQRGLAVASHQSRHDASPTAAALFIEIARGSKNPELVAVAENLADRLGPLQGAEASLFEDLAEELAALRAAFTAEDKAALRREIAAYHRRRQRRVPELLLGWRLAATHREETTGK
jgi:DNA-binding GntR family transcriptional regulator